LEFFQVAIKPYRFMSTWIYPRLGLNYHRQRACLTIAMALERMMLDVTFKMLIHYENKPLK